MKLRILSFLLILILVFTATNVNAINFNYTDDIVLPIDKISGSLAERLDHIDESEMDQKMPLYVWYKDIDQISVDNEVEKLIGLTREELSIDNPVFSESDTMQNDSIEEWMNSYLKSTNSARELEEQRTDKFIMTRRDLSREKYSVKSEKIKESISLKDEDIIFNSEYAPMIICEMTKNEVLEALKQPQIEFVNIYEELQIEACTPSSVKSTTHIDNLHSKLNLTGQGVKIGMIDTGFPQSNTQSSASIRKYVH